MNECHTRLFVLVCLVLSWTLVFECVPAHTHTYAHTTPSPSVPTACAFFFLPSGPAPSKTVNNDAAEERGALAVEGYVVQVHQHLHRRPVRLHRADAHHASPGVLPGRHRLLRVPLPALLVPGGQGEAQRVRAVCHELGGRGEGEATTRNKTYIQKNVVIFSGTTSHNILSYSKC